jgi:hypothetical protein
VSKVTAGATMAREVSCQSCNGLGVIVFPEVEMLNGERYYTDEHSCLSCGGSGKFMINENGGIEYTEKTK